VLKAAFQQACESAVTKLAEETADGGPALLVGSPWREDGKLYNAAVLLDQGRVATARYNMRSAQLRACSTRSACSRRAARGR